MKMNNQGLEALAALASAAPSTATNRGTGDSSNGSGERGGSREASGTAASVGSDNGSSSRDVATQGAQSAQHGEQAAHPAQLAQWQQLMSNLTSSGGNPNVLGSNPGAGLGLLSGMQLTPSGDNSSLMMAMQNMAHYQLMAQAQAQAQAQAASQNQLSQLSALSNLAAQLSRSNPSPGGLGLLQQSPFAQLLKGKFIVTLVIRLRDQRKGVHPPLGCFSLRLG